MNAVVRPAVDDAYSGSDHVKIETLVSQPGENRDQGGLVIRKRCPCFVGATCGFAGGPERPLRFTHADDFGIPGPRELAVDVVQSDLQARRAGVAMALAALSVSPKARRPEVLDRTQE